jgi:2-polyprenyl-3-methyl-5-hydroxy-6-metoxy-1,4-benzoquinol methylase
MAKDWQEAQANERVYWEKAFKNDGSSTKANRVEYIYFTSKMLSRHKYDITRLENAVIGDLGCGPVGAVPGLELLNKGYFKEIYGIDPLMDYYKTIGILKENEIVKLTSEKVEDMVAEKSKFDIIVSTNVLDHVDSPDAFINNVYSLLKDGGIFLVSSHCIKSFLIPVKPIIKYIDKNHPHHFDNQYLQILLRKSFSRVEHTYTASIREDHPNFKPSLLFKQPSLRSIKRVISNFVLHTNYFTCYK